MTEQELRDFLDENKASIQATVKQKMIDSLLMSHRWDLAEAIAKVIRDFIDAEIIPGVRAHLIEQKGPILQAAIATTSEIGEMLAKGMIQHVAKKLAPGSYEYGKIMQAMFGG